MTRFLLLLCRQLAPWPASAFGLLALAFARSHGYRPQAEPLEPRHAAGSIPLSITPDPLFTPAFRLALTRAAADVALSLPDTVLPVTVRAVPLPLDRLAETDATESGVVTFNSNTPQPDPYSTMTHELGHELGVGQAPQWFAQVRDGYFYGANAVAVNNGPVLLTDGNIHIARGLTVAGRPAAMGADVADTHANLSELDVALFRDLGITAAYVDPIRHQLPPPATPFPGFVGAVASASGDFDGDGLTDFAFAAQTGGRSHVAVFSGATGQILFSQIAYPGFDGVVQLGMGDADGDGRDDVQTRAQPARHFKAFGVNGLLASEIQ